MDKYIWWFDLSDDDKLSWIDAFNLTQPIGIKFLDWAFNKHLESLK